MDDKHNNGSPATIAGRTLDDFLVDPNFQGAFVGGPPLMTHKQARQIIEHPEEVQQKALAALRRLAEEMGEEGVEALEEAGIFAEG